MEEPNKKFAVIIVAKNRWELTEKCLDSLYYSDQPQEDYDLFLIDNASNTRDKESIRDWVKSQVIPVKNLFMIKSAISIPLAYNLGWWSARKYRWRVKLDNDIVLANTPVNLAKESDSTSAKRRPNVGGTNPGAVQNASIIRGIGQTQASTRTKPTHTAFLSHMEDFAKESNANISCLVSIAPRTTFRGAYESAVKQKWRELPYVNGACMMVHKDCFDKIGYFEERIGRRIDVEYSQRAIKAGFNIGYNYTYGVFHVGHDDDTDSAVKQKKIQNANRFLDEKITTDPEFYHSKWENLRLRVARAANKHTIVNVG